MKALLLFLTVVFFFTTKAYSKERVDCKKEKKFSMKAALCKTKATEVLLKINGVKKEN